MVSYVNCRKQFEYRVNRTYEDYRLWNNEYTVSCGKMTNNVFKWSTNTNVYYRQRILRNKKKLKRKKNHTLYENATILKSWKKLAKYFPI